MTSLFLLLASALFQQIKMHVTCKVGKGLTAVIYKTFQQITQKMELRICQTLQGEIQMTAK